jgi:hypothetical protein
MAKKMTLMSTLKCKTTDGKVVHYFVYHRGGGFEIVGPNLERHRCHPSVKNAKDAQIEIAKVYGVEVNRDPPRDRAEDGHVSAGIPRKQRPGNPRRDL